MTRLKVGLRSVETVCMMSLIVQAEWKIGYGDWIGIVAVVTNFSLSCEAPEPCEELAPRGFAGE